MSPYLILSPLPAEGCPMFTLPTKLAPRGIEVGLAAAPGSPFASPPGLPLPPSYPAPSLGLEVATDEMHSLCVVGPSVWDPSLGNMSAGGRHDAVLPIHSCRAFFSCPAHPNAHSFLVLQTGSSWGSQGYLCPHEKKIHPPIPTPSGQNQIGIFLRRHAREQECSSL